MAASADGACLRHARTSLVGEGLEAWPTRHPSPNRRRGVAVGRGWSPSSFSTWCTTRTGTTTASLLPTFFRGLVSVSDRVAR